MPDIGIYAGALVIAYLVPGADMILLLRTGGTDGRKHALATAAGLALARTIHVTAAGCGLATLLRTSPWLFDIIRYIGAIYLIWLSIQILLSARDCPLPSVHLTRDKTTGYFKAIQRGLVTNVTNPKSLLFCPVLLPQFIVPSYSAGWQFFMLGTILVLIGAAFDVFYSCAGTSMGEWLKLHPKIYRIQQSSFAALLMGFAVHLAFAARITG